MSTIDELESRVLLAGVTLNNGVLKITTTKKLDIVTVTSLNVPGFRMVDVDSSGGFSIVNKLFPLKKVKRIEIRSGGGNDTIQIIGNHAPLFADLGGGNDRFGATDGGRCTVSGGNGIDTIDGGMGVDSINGGAGIDLIDGRLGNDILIGGPANDLLLGGEGNDVIIARDGGVDRINGGNGADRATVDFSAGATIETIEAVETIR